MEHRNRLDAGELSTVLDCLDVEHEAPSRPYLARLQHAFKTPGLRNIDRRAPFMHDGSLATLRDVVEHYDEGGIKRPSLSNEVQPLGLTEQEKRDLVAFMEVLTSDDEPVTYVQLPR